MKSGSAKAKVLVLGITKMLSMNMQFPIINDMSVVEKGHYHAVVAAVGRREFTEIDPRTWLWGMALYTTSRESIVVI